MSEVLRGLGISAGILLPIVILIVIISIAAVRRGEAAMQGEAHEVSTELRAHVPDAKPTATAAQKPDKTVAATTEDISVMEILLLGFALFGLTFLFLLGVSVLGHLT